MSDPVTGSSEVEIEDASKDFLKQAGDLTVGGVVAAEVFDVRSNRKFGLAVHCIKREHCS